MKKLLMSISVLVVLIFGGCATSSPPKPGDSTKPIANQALAAPAIDLAQGYLSSKMITEYILPAAKSGINIQMGGETINKSNVGEYQLKYQSRLLTYRKAIKQRGYKTISGKYRASTTESCARVRSSWVGLNDIKIIQDGFDAQVIASTIHEGTKVSLKNQAAIVESSIVLQDAMNTDYFFRGVIKDKRIEIKPDVSVLRSWPKWAGPPSKKDLENCTITLKKK
jgi:hypothetical protein